MYIIGAVPIGASPSGIGPCPLLANAVGQVRDSRGVDDVDDLERDAVEITIVEQPDTRPEKDRDDANDQFVEQPGPEALLYHARPISTTS
jgi:hypothetical protein